MADAQQQTAARREVGRLSALTSDWSIIARCWDSKWFYLGEFSSWPERSNLERALEAGLVSKVTGRAASGERVLLAKRVG